ncbi:MAG: hypothetical protein JWQ49_6119, partial [Edaphobacter sp.]|nr:hypothetical protein [Edaphobacter sp.]
EPATRFDQLLKQRKGNLSMASKKPPEKSGGLNGSMQHLPGVYLPEFQIPKFFLDVD